MVNPTPKKQAHKSPTSAASHDANLLQVETDLQAALSLRVRFKPGSTGVKGTIEIDYYTPDDLDRLYELCSAHR